MIKTSQPQLPGARNKLKSLRLGRRDGRAVQISLWSQLEWKQPWELVIYFWSSLLFHYWFLYIPQLLQCILLNILNEQSNQSFLEILETVAQSIRRVRNILSTPLYSDLSCMNLHMDCRLQSVDQSRLWEVPPFPLISFPLPVCLGLSSRSWMKKGNYCVYLTLGWGCCVAQPWMGIMCAVVLYASIDIL